jgi:uncharacterized RDD family membrane protein YckC
MIYTAPRPGSYDWLWDDSLTTGVRTRRCFAWLVDLVLIGFFAMAVWWTLALIGLITFGLSWPLLSFVPLLPFAYHCLFLTGSMSATPGQAMMGLIVRRNDDFGPPTLAQAIASTLIFYLTLATTGLLLLVCLFTDRKRTLHDMVSGLVVVRTRVWQRWALTDAPGFWNMDGGPPHA